MDLAVLLRNCPHDNNVTSSTRIRYALKCDNMSLNIDSDNYKNINLGVPVIKIAKVGTYYSFPIGILVIERFIEEIEKLTNSKNSETKYQVSFHDPQWEKLHEYIWQ